MHAIRMLKRTPHEIFVKGLCTRGLGVGRGGVRKEGEEDSPRDLACT